MPSEPVDIEPLFLQSRRWLLFVVVLGGGFVIMSVTASTIPLPDIVSDFNVKLSHAQWILIVFSIVLTILLFPIGQLGDQFGTRLLFIIGLIFFCLGSLLAGFSENMSMMIAARVFQAVGTAAIIATGTALAALAYPREQRAFPISIVAGSNAVFTALGPLAGGVLNSYMGWRWVFWINVPFLLLAIVILLLIPRQRKSSVSKRFHFDFIGVFVFALVIVSLLLPLVESLTWPLYWVWGLLFVALLFIILLWRIETKVKHPLLDMEIVRNRMVLSAAFAYFLGNSALFRTFFFASMVFQIHLDFSPVKTGAVLMPISLGLVIASLLAGRLNRSCNATLLLAFGLFMEGCGLVVSSLAATGSLAFEFAIVCFFMMGLGVGVLAVTSRTAAINAVPESKATSAVALVSTGSRFGSAFGIAIGGVILHFILPYELLRVLEEQAIVVSNEFIPSVIKYLGSYNASDTLAKIGHEETPQLTQAMFAAFSKSLDFSSLVFAACILLMAGIYLFSYRKSKR